jgi:hypothetical protein
MNIQLEPMSDLFTVQGAKMGIGCSTALEACFLNLHLGNSWRCYNTVVQ